nr:hypothetical protein [Ferrimicrobium acidiphilum]
MAGLNHRIVDLAGKVELELLEAGLDFLRLSAVLVELGNTPLEVNTGANRADNFVTGPDTPPKSGNLCDSSSHTRAPAPLLWSMKFTTTT